MKASGQNHYMQEALRRFLPDANNPKMILEEKDPTVELELANKLADCLSKFSAGPVCKPVDRHRSVAGSDQPASLVTMIFTIDETGAKAWIDVPSLLIRSLFLTCLGGVSQIATQSANALLSKVERHFTATVASEFAKLVASRDSMVIDHEIFFPDGTEIPNKPESLEHLAFVVTVNGCDLELAIHLPKSPMTADIAHDRLPTLASKTGRLLLQPELRLRLAGMTLRDIKNLKRGDVLSMMPGTSSAMALLTVADKSILACELGQIAGRYSARIVGPEADSVNSRATILDRGGY